PANLTLVGNRDDGPFSWGSSYFPSGGLNTDWSDGLAYYNAFTGTCGSTPTATSGGLLVTTLLFSTNGNYTVTTVSILASSGSYSTRAYDDLPIPGVCPGVEISPLTIGGAASVTIYACSVPADCDDSDYCTFNLCNSGTCSHPPNYNDSLYCCNPANGILAELSDGNDCTQDNCNTETGQVTHPNEANGTACGDDTDDYCTNPDTCSGGVCVSNDAGNGTWCELNGDECTMDRCSGGVCVTIETLPDDDPCDDGKDNCTPGQDTCQGGVCVGGGDNPCIFNPGQPYCQEREAVGDPCLNGDSDCVTVQDFYCEHLNGSPCPTGGADCECKRPYSCVHCASAADCPTSGNCYTYLCHPYGYCFQYVNNGYCQNGNWCDGEEWCEIEMFIGYCRPDLMAPCQDPDYPICREETCCDGPDCDDDWCDCVACTSNAHCDDGLPCNGEETCDVGMTYICLPGTPIDCTYLDDDCNVGVCNPVTGDCEAHVITELIGVPSSCNDGELCTFFDACTASGGCIGEEPSLDGSVDLDMDPDAPLTLDIDDTFEVDLYVVSNGLRCLEEPAATCASDEDCNRCSVSAEVCDIIPKRCNGGPHWLELCDTHADCRDVPSDPWICEDDCVGGSNECVPGTCRGDHHLSGIEAAVTWDPEVVELIGKSDGSCSGTSYLCRTCATTTTKKCTITLNVCTSDGNCPRQCVGGLNPGIPCTSDANCVGNPPTIPHGECSDNFCEDYCLCTSGADCLDGLGCYCTSPPCGTCNDGGSTPCSTNANCPVGYVCGSPTGTCVTGQYDWFSSLPVPGKGALNFTWDDGDAFYLAMCQLTPAGMGAPLTTTAPLFITTLEFRAVGGSLGSEIQLADCVAGTVGVKTDVFGDGGVITGSLDSVSLRVNNCDIDADCDDGLWCTGEETCDTTSRFAGVCLDGTPPCAEPLMCDEPNDRCVDCLLAEHCNDDVNCTDDACVDGACENVENCPDDGLFCTGVEYCDFDENSCMATGDPCPGYCDEELDECASVILPPLPQTAYVPPTPCVYDTDCAVSPGSTGSVCIAVGDVSRCYNPKNTYLSFDPNNFEPAAFKVMLSASLFHPGAVGTQKWVDDPKCYQENGTLVTPTPSTCPAPKFWMSGLVDVKPPMRTWALGKIVHIGSCLISPVATYEIRATGDDGGSFSDPLVIPTIRGPSTQWGDVVGQKDGVNQLWTGPNRIVNFDDVSAAIAFFTSASVRPHLTVVDVERNMILNFLDINRLVGAFQGKPYPFGNTNDPCAAPQP
ncbi:MAG: hypothetical protein KJ749_07095, partial [Planctomycetes bacterium]|nr:hypothetical protein [Planctomycetota bacterium]